MAMRVHTFDSVAELEDIEQRLARGSQHPVYVDLGDAYDPDDDSATGFNPSRVADLEEQANLAVVWNNRDDRRAYVSSDEYELVQHREVIDKIRSAVGDTVGDIDKGVIRDYGEKVDGVLVFGNQDDARIDVEDLVSGYVPPEGPDWTQDRLGLGMRFQNSFDGGTKVGGSTMAYRYICANWMVWGESEIGRVEQVHRTRLTEDFFEGIIGEVFDAKEDLESIVVESEEDRVPLTWAPTVLEQAGFGRNYRHNILEILQGMEHPSPEETSLWRIYQAVTTYLDQDKVDDIGNGIYNSHQHRAWNVLTMDRVEPPEEEPDSLTEVVS